MPALAKVPHIVVVDNDLDIQELISAYFKPKGFKVSSYLDAKLAIKDGAKDGADWDVILSDMHFHCMSTAEFNFQIKKLLPDLPIILITDHDAAEKAVEAVTDQKAYDFVVKPIVQPIHFSHLKIAIQRALALKAMRTDMTELRESVKTSAANGANMIGRSPLFLAAVDIAKRVAASRANIFITGESGTGKEVFAKFIHQQSKHQKGPFVPINCSSIPENLLESELFGHTKGAFTGAIEKRIGLFEEAEDGTLFLDEIGDLSLSLQAKLLRVLQEKTIKRVGENQQRLVNCRIISATHKDLANEVSENRFREDLYFRLNVIPICIPPLRERMEDLMPLAATFLRRFALENASPARTFSKDATKFLLDSTWRGNVRELENTIERAVALCSNSEICLEDLMPQAVGLGEANLEVFDSADKSAEQTFRVQHSSELPKLDEIIHQYIEYAIKQNGGARDKTARDIGIDRKTLYKRMRIDHNLSL